METSNPGSPHLDSSQQTKKFVPTKVGTTSKSFVQIGPKNRDANVPTFIRGLLQYTKVSSCHRCVLLSLPSRIFNSSQTTVGRGCRKPSDHPMKKERCPSCPAYVIGRRRSVTSGLFANRFHFRIGIPEFRLGISEFRFGVSEFRSGIPIICGCFCSYVYTATGAMADDVSASTPHPLSADGVGPPPRLESLRSSRRY